MIFIFGEYYKVNGMKKYLEVFDILYEIKENISDKHFVTLNNIFKEMYAEIENYEEKEYRNNKNFDYVIRIESDNDESNSDDNSDEDENSEEETPNSISLKQYIENIDGNNIRHNFNHTNLEQYLQRTQGDKYSPSQIDESIEQEVRDAVPVKDLENPSRIVFFVIDNGELNLVELDENNLGEIVGPVEEDENGIYEFNDKKWKLK